MDATALKQCKQCGKLLMLTDFYVHPKMADGHLNHCKPCVKLKVSLHRQINLEKLREYDRQRYKDSPKRQLQLKNLQHRHFSDPVKRKATRATSNAIRDGRLLRPNHCSQCACACKPEAHHEDYSKPLDVVWLCRSCHCKVHSRTINFVLKQ